MKNTKKSLLVSVLSLMLCVAMLLGTTYAWFTDSVTSGVNTIVAGNLDIDVLHTNAKVSDESIKDKTNLFVDKDGNAIKWEPGVISYENFTVKNLGNLALKYKLAMNITDYNALGTHTLKEVLKVKVLSGENMLASVTRADVAALDWDTSDTLDVFNTAGDLLIEESDEFQVIVYWQPTENDNQWNVNNGQKTSDGKALFIDFGINVVATQLDSETDSFGSDYDKGLVLPDLPASINKTFQSEPITNKEIATETVEVKNKSTNTGVATMPKAAVEAVVDKLLEEATDKKDNTDVSTVIYLKVETTEKTETAVTYNIDLSAIMTYTDKDGGEKTKELTSLDGYMGDQIITAVMNIGKGLSGVTVKHNGTSMAKLTSATQKAEGYFYDKLSGNLTIKSKSFSPFTVDYTIDAEAAIGDTVYATLEEAVAAAKDGDTIALMNNITLTKQVKISGKVTIDLNGKTVNADTVQYPFYIGKGSDVVFTDSIGNGLVTQTYTSTYADLFEVYSKLTVNGGTYTTNGTYGVFYRNSGCELYINDGIFNAGKPVGGSQGAVAFNGGYFSNKFDAPVGYKLEEVDLNGAVYYRLVLLTEEDAVASITRESNVIYFDSLDAAIKNAAATESIVLLKDATLPEGYSLSKACTVNLNGKTVTPSIESCESINYYAVTENGICTVYKIGKWSEKAAESYATPIAEKVVTIASAEELALFAKQVNAGTSYTGYTVKLTADIDLNKNAWDKPIGMSGKRFGGTFDGQNHTISNMKATSTPSYGNGLFADMNPNASIKNLTISNAYVGGSFGYNVYGIVSGYAYGTVTFENITVKDSYVGGYGKVGGILGMAADPGGTTKLINCKVMNTTIEGYYNCGGLIGATHNPVELTSCTTENVTWKKGDLSSAYVEVNSEFKKNTDTVQLNGTYWKYSSWLYAAWGDYYIDLYHYDMDYTGTVGDRTYTLADGGCHNK